MVRTEDAVPVKRETETGFKASVELTIGVSVTFSVTLPANPLRLLSEIVYVARFPCGIVIEAGLAPIEKSGADDPPDPATSPSAVAVANPAPIPARRSSISDQAGNGFFSSALRKAFPVPWSPCARIGLASLAIAGQIIGGFLVLRRTLASLVPLAKPTMRAILWDKASSCSSPERFWELCTDRWSVPGTR